jgi:hypothetical protein
LENVTASPHACDRNGHLFENEVRIVRAAQLARNSIVSKLQGTPISGR